MRQRLSQLLLFTLILLVGCKGEPPSPRKVVEEGAPGNPRSIGIAVGEEKSRGGAVITADLPVGSSGDEVTATLPEPTRQQLYEQALLESIDHLAERHYKEALASLEKAQKLNDTGAVQREIYKVQAMLDQQGGAEKAVQDVKTVLDDGKADEAAKLASAALGQYGGGDRADELAKLKQEADAVVTASYDNTAARKAALAAEAEAAIANKNLRAAAVSLEQAIALGEDAVLSRQLSGIQAKLSSYDDCRTRAAQLRKDPTRVDEAITLLKQAAEAWPTLLVQQEIDECQLILERRRDRVSVADLEVLGDVGVGDAGRIIAAELLPHFRPRFDIVERAQINRVLAELNIDAGDLADNEAGRRELGRSARLRYLVVGNLSSLGGVTLQARLVEVSTGLIVQTARITAPNVEALVPKLKPVALMLQMTDEQKLAFEEALIQKVVAVKPIEAAPVVELPPPPPPPAPRAPLPPPIVTYTPRPPAMGGIVVEDFGRLPVAYVAPPPPQPLAVILPAEDPRRHRLFRLSLELGDNCFKRGLFRDAQRHFQLAISVGGPRRELSLRLDACRPLVAPPPPPPVVIVPAAPVVVMPSPLLPPPPPPIVVARPPVLIARPRVAVFGWVCSCRPGLVPPAASEILADQFASYCRGSYEVIDRGEVCWYMGRLGLTMREVLNDERSRRCLAQALNARYFVFGSLRETASFDAETHLVDPETGTRAGTGKIHVKDQDELKLRLSELARQIGAKPDEQKAMVAKAAAGEKTLRDARGLLSTDPAKAADVARAGLKDNPNSTALQTVVADADRRARMAKLEADRRAEAASQAKAQEAAKKRQAELAKQGAEAKAKAEAEAAARGDAAKKTQQLQRQRAAESLRAQARQAMAKGNYPQALQQLQSAANLQPGEDVFKELAAAKVASEKAAADRALAEQKKRDEDAKVKREAAAKLVLAEKEKRDKADADRRKGEDARAQTLHDGFLQQANAEMAKKEYAKALASAESARRLKATPEAAKLAAEAQQQLALANAKDAAERKRLEDERAKRDAADKKLARDREMYSAAMKKAQDALGAKKFDEAASQFTAAAKLFDTDAAKGGLKTVNELRAQEKKNDEAARLAKEAAAKRTAMLKEKLDEGKKLRDAKQFAKAVEAYREAVKLVPGNVDAVAGLSAAERERDAEARDKAVKARQDAINRHLAAGSQALAKKQFAEAEKSAREALKLAPDNATAKKLLADATAVKPPPPPPSMDAPYKAAMQRAGQLMATKKFADAERAYDEALKAKPGDGDAIKGKRAAMEASKPTKPAADPKMKERRDAYLKEMAEARAAVKDRKFGEAVKSFDDALKQQPGDPVATKERAAAVTEGAYAAHMARGAQSLAKKQFADARKAFEEALKLKPTDPVATKGVKDSTPPPPPAKDGKEKAPLAKQAKEDYDLAMGAGAAAMKKLDYKGAINSYTEALRKMPGDKAATAAIAGVRYAASMAQAAALMKQKKFDDAEKAYDDALKAKPGDPAAIKGKKEADAAAKKK